MKKFMTAGAALLMTTSIANAGGLDRSGQGIGVIFEDTGATGAYVELSYGSVNADLSGTFAGGQSGDIAPRYGQLGMAFKQQLTEQFSLSMIYDQPFGASVNYSTLGYALTGVNAEVESDGVTVLGRYEINPSFSVHGGLRYVQANGVYDIVAYESIYDTDGDFGYVLGGAYEREDIAMRVALTYSSGIDLELDGNFFGNTLTANLPESVNLDFQTGVAADTLVFGSIRYVAWDGFQLVDSNDPTGDGNILSYDDDVITYNVGVGRRFSDNFSASFGIGYEKSTGELTGQLGPTDGYISYQVGGAYTLDSGIEVSGGIRYVDVGDANTNPVAPAPFGQTYTDNNAIAIGLKVAYAF